MNFEWIRSMLRWLSRAITEPRGELDRWERAMRFAYDLTRFGAKQLRTDQAPRMAGALAFRTLFGLLPVMVVSTVLVKAMQGVDQFRQTLTGLMENAGLYNVVVNLSSDAGETSESLGTLLESVIGDAAQVNLAAVGWVGLGVLIYTAISLMATVEGCFNSICRAPEGRPWLQRIPVYFFVLIGWPAAFGIIAYASSRFGGWLESVSDASWLLGFLPGMWAFVCVWLVMLAIYMLVPNTSLRLRNGLVGSFVAAALIEFGRWALGAYLKNTISIEQLYGSLGLIPLFMFWVYVMWLFILFGLEVASILQRLGGRDFEEFERSSTPTGLVDPAAIVAVMQVVGARFGAGNSTRLQAIVEETSLPENAVMAILERLTERHLVHRVAADEPVYTLAQPPEKIAADELMQIGFELTEGAGHLQSLDLIQRLREAQKQLASQFTLAGLAPEEPAKSAGQAIAGS